MKSPHFFSHFYFYCVDLSNENYVWVHRMQLKLNLIKMFEYGWMVGKFSNNFHSKKYTSEKYLSYDMVHFGHANACRQAKQMGSYLIVGVHSDG